ncbi:MAG: hypothetical protein ACREFI_16890 [Stellaceae bacterium]
MTDYANPFSSLDQALDTAADAIADSITGALSDSVSEVVCDPLVLSMMAADRVDPTAFEAMLRRMAGKLANRGDRPFGSRSLCSC